MSADQLGTVELATYIAKNLYGTPVGLDHEANGFPL